MIDGTSEFEYNRPPKEVGMHVPLQESNRIVVTEQVVHDEFENEVRYLAEEGWTVGEKIGGMSAQGLRDVLKQYLAQITRRAGEHHHIAAAYEGVFLSAACQRALRDNGRAIEDRETRSFAYSYVVISQQSLVRALVSLPYEARQQLWRGAAINQLMIWGMAGAYGVAMVARELSSSIDVYLSGMQIDKSWGFDLICPVSRQQGYCVQVKCGPQTVVELASGSTSSSPRMMEMLRNKAFRINRVGNNRSHAFGWRPALVTVKMARLPEREQIVRGEGLRKLVNAVQNFS